MSPRTASVPLGLRTCRVPRRPARDRHRPHDEVRPVEAGPGEQRLVAAGHGEPHARRADEAPGARLADRLDRPPGAEPVAGRRGDEADDRGRVRLALVHALGLPGDEHPAGRVHRGLEVRTGRPGRGVWTAPHEPLVPRWRAKTSWRSSHTTSSWPSGLSATVTSRAVELTLIVRTRLNVARPLAAQEDQPRAQAARRQRDVAAGVAHERGDVLALRAGERAQGGRAARRRRRPRPHAALVVDRPGRPDRRAGDRDRVAREGAIAASPRSTPGARQDAPSAGSGAAVATPCPAAGCGWTSRAPRRGPARSRPPGRCRRPADGGRRRPRRVGDGDGRAGGPMRAAHRRGERRCGAGAIPR